MHSAADLLETRKIETQEGEVKGEDPQDQDHDLPGIVVVEGDRGLVVDLGHPGALPEAGEDDVYVSVDETSRTTDSYTGK